VPWLTSVDGWPVESVPPLTDIRQLGRCRSSQLTSAAVVVPHANHGGRVTAPLASQWNVSEGLIAVRALATDQERPGHVSDPAAFRAGRSQMRVALCLGNGPASPKRINFHNPEIHGSKLNGVEKQRAPGLTERLGAFSSSASRTSGCGLGMSGWLAPECGEGEAFVMEGREDRAAVQSPPGAAAAQPVASAGSRLGAGQEPRRVYEQGRRSGAFSVLGDLREWP
jgi:hypothetical protein